MAKDTHTAFKVDGASRIWTDAQSEPREQCNRSGNSSHAQGSRNGGSGGGVGGGGGGSGSSGSSMIRSYRARVLYRKNFWSRTNFTIDCL
jgi:hypothetical protein